MNEKIPHNHNLAAELLHHIVDLLCSFDPHWFRLKVNFF